MGICRHDDSVQLRSHRTLSAYCVACHHDADMEYAPAPGIGRRFVMERVDSGLVKVGVRASHDGLIGCAILIEEFAREGWRRMMCTRPLDHDGPCSYRPLDMMYRLDARKLRAPVTTP